MDAGLACHIVQSMIKQDFDVTSVGCLKPGQSMPHAYAFVVRRIMNARIVPIVPVFLNTFYPPPLAHRAALPCGRPGAGEGHRASGPATPGWRWWRRAG
ncbi:MAG: hypothetical protein EXR51_06870 [Dehalococcoidia bacterium]|nr:hypothetical protein [Dehalococcoidia bacterium]